MAALIDAQKAGDYNLIGMDDVGLDPSVLNRFYLSAAVPNWTHYADSDLDAWLNQAAATLDPGQRTPLYNQAQERIMQQALILPIRDEIDLNGANAAIGGLGYDASGLFPLLPNLSYDPNPSSSVTPPATAAPVGTP